MSSRAKQLSNLEIFKFREFGILMVLVVFVVLLSVATDTFLTSTNIINVVDVYKRQEQQWKNYRKT